MMNMLKRGLSLLCTLAMLLSMVTVVDFSVNATETAPDNELAELPEELQDVDASHITIIEAYNSFSTGGGAVADPDSYNGVAYSYADVDMVNAGLDIFANDGWGLGKIFLTEPVEGYKYYKLSFTTPSSFSGSIICFTGSWMPQNTILYNELKALPGQTLDLYICMKVTGELTNATVCFDRLFLVDYCEQNMDEDGIRCQKCGKVFVCDELLDVDASHITTINAYNTFSTGGGTVSDPDSYNGVVYSYSGVDMVNTGLNIFTNEGLDMGSVTLTEAVEGYQYYKISFPTHGDASGFTGSVVCFTVDWMPQNAALYNELKARSGQNLELYISMKVTGELTNATVHFDRLFLVDNCEDNMGSDGVCTVCGKAADGEDPEPSIPETTTPENTDPAITDPENTGEYKISVTGPVGIVYPYTDRVKTYLQTENANMNDYYEFGTREEGDASFKPVSITWKDVNSSVVTKYVVEYATSADYTDAISVVKTTKLNEKQVDLYNLYKATTYYVRVTAYTNDTVVGQAESTFETTDLGPRIMKIDGIYNVRDLGGYKTVDGKTTLQGMIFRGSEMDGSDGIALTHAGDAYMSNVMGIKTDLDLRGNGNKSPISSAEKVSIGIGAYLDAFSQKEQYRQIFATLADESNYPVYIHCAGGADRTGTIGYLINALLGVPEEDLIRDYEMTSYSIFNIRTKDHSQYKFRQFVAQLKAYEGETLVEKTENYMLSIGVTEAEINNIRAIMLGEEVQEIVVVSPQAVFNVYEDAEFAVAVSGDKEITSVVINGEEVVFTKTETGFTVAAENMPEMENGTVSATVVFADETTVDFQFKCNNVMLSEELAGADETHKIVYEYNQFSSATGVVADAEAAKGWATYVSNVDLVNTQQILIHRYDPGAAASSYRGITIGTLSADEVKMNEGYQLYKFTVDIPAGVLTDGNYVFFLSDWTLRLLDLCKDMKTLEGKTVDMYLSMKVTGDSASDCTVYVDQFNVVTHCEDYVGSDGCCTQCGNDIGVEGGDEPTEPEVTDPLAEELAAIADVHKSVVVGEEFFGDGTLAADPESFDGFPYYFEADLNTTGFYICLPEYAGFATAPAEKIQLSDTYRLYKCTAKIPENISGSHALLFGNYSAYSFTLANQIVAHAGQDVDFYISLKATGEQNNAMVYIDSITIVSRCENYRGSDGCCTQCGSFVDIEEPDPTEPEVTEPDTTEPENPNTLPDELRNINPSHITTFEAYNTFSTGGDVVKVTDAYNESVYSYSGVDMVNNGLDIFTNDGLPLGKVHITKVVEGYQIYKIPFPNHGVASGFTGSVVCFTGSWMPQNAALYNELKSRPGQNLDLYISMKVTGELTNATVCFDRLFLVDHCEDNWGSDGVCTVCGQVNTPENPKLPEELLNIDASHITILDAYNTFAVGGEEATDSKSYNGVVYSYSGVDMKNGGLDIFTNDGIVLGKVKLSKSVEGYRVYKISFSNASSFSGSVVCFTGTWMPQNAALYNELKSRPGQNLDLYISMKVTGELTNATVYFDRLFLVDNCEENKSSDNVCTVCGKVVVAKDSKLPEELKNVDTSHITIIEAYNTFSNGGGVVTDTDSYNGVVYSYSGVDMVNAGLNIFTNDGLAMGAVKLTKAVEGYQYYKISFASHGTASGFTGSVVCFTGSWMPQNAALYNALKSRPGQNLDLYFSMKVTGELTNATIYIDRLLLVDSCEDNMGTDGACTVCGKSMVSDDSELPEELQIVDASHITTLNAYNTFSNGGDVVTDTDSYNGVVYSYSGVDMVNNGLYIFTNEGMNMGEVKLTEAVEGYQVYKISFKTHSDASGFTGSVVCFTVDWVPQNAFLYNELKARPNQNLDLYITMKVTGELTNATVYIDRLFLVDHCQDNLDSDGVCAVCGKLEDSEATDPENTDIQNTQRPQDTSKPHNQTTGSNNGKFGLWIIFSVICVALVVIVLAVVLLLKKKEK